MDSLPKSRLLRFVERAMVLARRAVARFSTRYSRKRFTLRQHVVLLCLKVKKTTTHRDLVDELIEMPRIRDALDLDSVPAPSTLCKAFDRLEMAVWRVLLNISLADLPLNGITGIRCFGVRAGACINSLHEANESHHPAVEDDAVGRYSYQRRSRHSRKTTRKHDTQIAPQVVKRNAGSITVLTGDQEYDDQKLRRLARNHNIRPLIKHREFTPLHKAWNARLDNDLYHRRTMNETVNAAIKQKFGAFVRSRLWWKQFRELVIKCIVHNLERSLAISEEEYDCP